MKILSLTAENVKKLTVVEISPAGNMVQITGKNGQGKSSVLDSIFWAIAGTEHIQTQPIRKGADKARIELKLGSGDKVELIVERRFTEKSSYLEVRTVDGAKYPKPQNMLDDLFGALTFDPLDFMRHDSEGQFKVLTGLVELDIDLKASAAADKTDYEERTKLNREAKVKRAQAGGIVVVDGLPEEPLSETELLDRLQEAANGNADIERRKANRAEAASQVIAARREAEARRNEAVLLREKADALVAAADTMDRGATDTEKKIADAGPLPEPADISGLRAEHDAAKATNAKIADRERRAAIANEAERLEAEAKSLTAAMGARAAERDEAIAKARMPIDGLSFGDGVVTFNGLPLDQASDAEQLTISTAIAAALNPKLRVIRIRDGSLLDDDAMQRLAAFADERDMQIWIERVDGSGTVGVVMEDGHVKGRAPAQEAAE